MANRVSYFRYKTKLRHILLGAGLEGISQFNLNQKMRTRHFDVSDMNSILAEWEEKEWVQQFKLTMFTKRPTTMWRATTKLRDEWANIKIEGDLPTDPVEEPIIPERMF